MTARTRRYVGAAVALVALLLLGRWTVAFVAERWWAARTCRRVARTGGAMTRLVICMARIGTDAASASALAGKSASDFRMNLAFMF